MFDLHLVAQTAAPPVQTISLTQLVVGIVVAVLTIIGGVWVAARALVTKHDLKTMATKADLDSMATKTDLSPMATKDDLAALRAENEKVHDGITKNVMENRRQIQQLDATMRSIDNSLAFLSGRQHERDRHDLRWAERRATGDDGGDAPVN